MQSILKLIIVNISCLALLLISSCQKEDTYTDSLPEHPSAVLAVDVKAMALKSGGVLQDKTLRQALISGLNGSDRAYAEQILKDPRKLGLAIEEPLYLFSSDSLAYVGILWKVKDIKDLTTFMESLQRFGIVHELQESKDMYLVKTQQNGVGAYDKNRFIVLFPVAGNENASLPDPTALLTLKKEASAPQEGFAKILTPEADISLWADMSALNRLPGVSQMPYAFSFPAMMNTILYQLNFEPGKVSLHTRSFPTSEEMKQIADNMCQAMGKFQGKLLNLVPRKSVLNAGMHVKDGSALLKDISRIAPAMQVRIDSLKSSGVDVQKLLSSLKGDILFDIESIQLSLPGMTIMAQVTDTSIGDFLISTLKGVNLNPVNKAEGVYSLENIGTLYNKDNLLILTTDDKILEQLPRNGFNPSLADSPCSRVYKDSYSGFCLNITEIMSSPVIDMIQQNQPPLQLVLRVMKNMQRLESRQSDCLSNEMILWMNDSKTNSLEVLLTSVRDILKK